MGHDEREEQGAVLEAGAAGPDAGQQRLVVAVRLNLVHSIAVDPATEL